MIAKEKILARVRKMLRGKPYVEFFPIIEEFFIRATEQNNWSEEELQSAIDRFDRVKKIEVEDLSGELVGGIEGIWTAITRMVDNGNNDFDIHIAFDIDIFKRILENNTERIEDWINISFHEFGHASQFRKIDERTWQNGIIEIQLNPESQEAKVIGNIMNEFAETINAERLQKGNILSGKFNGYSSVQNAAKAVLYSFGLTEEELANLQNKGRDEYKKVCMQRMELPIDYSIKSSEYLLDYILKFARR